MAIVAVSDVQAMLGLGTEDTLGGRLDGLVDAACAMVEGYVNRWLTKKQYTQVCSGGGGSLALKAYPVESVAAVTMDGVAVADTVLDANKGLLYRSGGRQWPPMPGGYLVTYTGGLSETPAPIKQAAALLVAALDDAMQNRGQNVAAERLGDYSVTYAKAADSVGLEALSAAAAALLRPYRDRPY